MNFKKAKKKAGKVAEDRERMMDLIHSVIEKMKKTEDRNELLKAAREKIATLTRMLKAYASGDYKTIPWKSLVLIVAGLIYFVNPLDLIPDFIPMIGLMDDLALLFWIFNSVNNDIEEYQAWEKASR